MRITQSSIAASTLANLQSSLARSSRLQEQLSSGKVINRASDSPSGTVSSLALRTQIGANEQFSRNANDAKAWLGTADSTLQSVNSRLQRVRELTLQRVVHRQHGRQLPAGDRLRGHEPSLGAHGARQHDLRRTPDLRWHDERLAGVRPRDLRLRG